MLRAVINARFHTDLLVNFRCYCKRLLKKKNTQKTVEMLQDVQNLANLSVVYVYV